MSTMAFHGKIRDDNVTYGTIHTADARAAIQHAARLYQTSNTSAL